MNFYYRSDDIQHGIPVLLSMKHNKRIKNAVFTFLFLVVGWSFFGCDFQSPADFEPPTWFVDIEFPLVTDTYPLGDLVDNESIFPTKDSLGLRLIFEDSLPSTAIDETYLQVAVNRDVAVAQDPVMSPTLDVMVDTVINISIPLTTGSLIDTNLVQFDIPPTEDHGVANSIWNNIASAVDTTVVIDINLPQVDQNDLPAFITSVDAVVITGDTPSDSSVYQTSIENSGIPTPLENVRFRLLTDTTSPLDTLANHTSVSVPRDQTFEDHTLLGGDSLGNAIRMEFGFGVAQETIADFVTIRNGDSVKVNLSIRLRIANVSDAVVSIAETDIAPEVPLVNFPSDIEIYSGLFATNTGININEIRVTNLASTFPFDIQFGLNFQNFLPPLGGDSVKIDTLLQRSNPSISKTYDIDGYTFSNPAGADQPLTFLDIAVTAILQTQQTSIPLDGSELGKFTLNIQVDELHFESLQANLVQDFPPTKQSITGMPSGFSGMAFTDVKIEFVMLNQIQLPVDLDILLKGVNTYGDSAFVSARTSIASPTVDGDTVKTIIRLSQLGTTTITYASPSDSVWADSTTTPPGEGESTIVEFLSFNPKSIEVESAARIDGRGTIVVGAAIEGSYRLLAPWEVRMDPMTFIPVTNTPIQEMDHDTRSRIRNSLVQSELSIKVVNSMPIGGELAILMSNQTYFPLDLNTSTLAAFRDSMVIAEGWSPTDSLYIITDCADLDPALGSTYIFNVMDDYRECQDSLVYLVKVNSSPVDTVISYVDTLLKVVLPEPSALYPDSSTTGVPGSVLTPGQTTYISTMDTSKIQLLTNYGDHYVTTRFHLNGTDGNKVYLSLEDYIGINSALTFTIRSTGIMESAQKELVILYPNGGETLNINQTYVVRWKTFGKISKVNLAYGTGSAAVADDETPWTSIATAIANVDSFLWTPSSTTGVGSLTADQQDSVKLRITNSDGSVVDVSGWYFTLSNSGRNVQGLHLSESGFSGQKPGNKIYSGKRPLR